MDAVVSPSIQVSNNDIVRVGVVEFSFARPQEEPNTSRPPNAGEIVADAIIDLPMRLGYEVIERKQLDALLKEHDLTAADLVRPETGVKIGRTLGIQAVIIGTVTELGTWSDGVSWGNVITFSARMVRLDTGEVLWTLKCERAGQLGFMFMLSDLTEQAARKLAVEGAKRQMK